MSMRHKIEKILRRYGTPILLRRAQGDSTLYGFWQHTGSLGWKNMQPVYSQLGEVPRGQYVYIGPAGQQVQTGETLEVGEKDYMLRRVEPVYYGEEIAYYWGMCVEKGGEDTWGQS